MALVLCVAVCFVLFLFLFCFCFVFLLKSPHRLLFRCFFFFVVVVVGGGGGGGGGAGVVRVLCFVQLPLCAGCASGLAFDSVVFCGLVLRLLKLRWVSSGGLVRVGGRGVRIFFLDCFTQFGLSLVLLLLPRDWFLRLLPPVSCGGFLNQKLQNLGHVLALSNAFTRFSNWAWYVSVSQLCGSSIHVRECAQS